MTIQTPVAPRIDVTHDDVIGALQNRSAALMRTSSAIYGLKAAPIDASKGDDEAARRVRDVILSARLGLSPHDIDIIDRLRDQLHLMDFFALSAIASDAKQRSYKVDIQIDKLNGLHAAGRRRAEAYKLKQADRKSAYTTAYEAAAKLSATQRRQLAEALLS